MTHMLDKIVTLWPEVALLVGACVCLAVGLSPRAGTRLLCAWVAGLSLVAAGGLLAFGVGQADQGLAAAAGTGMTGFVKAAIVGVGLLLLLVAASVPSELERDAPGGLVDGDGKFDPGSVMRGEFFAFFLFSLAGAMLCAGANDLVWLFLALELTSLPTYVLVATSRDRADAQESAVKYFFLGAMAAAVFLYGFTLIYGSTGLTNFDAIRAYVAAFADSGEPLAPLLRTGLILAILGVSFKIAAVPMHFYAADVYQGAATPVTAMLAFVPKTAGFVSLILLLSLVQPAGAEATRAVTWLLCLMAALTMTVGNVLGLLQHNVKRVLAYSSIAHSGYILVGLVGFTEAGSTALGNGTAAVLFYLVAYGLATVGAFAVLGCIGSRGDEAQTYDDLAGLGRRHPVLGAAMLISVLSLLGLPPMIGFIGKIYLFGSAIDRGYTLLVIIAVLNSAVSAVYYLRIAAACYFRDPAAETVSLAVPWRRAGAVLAAISALVLGVAGGRLVDAAHVATAGQAQAVAHVSSVAP